MIWTPVGSTVVNQGWNFTDTVVSGSLFRLTLVGATIGDSFWASQAQKNDDGSIEFNDCRLLPVSQIVQVLEFLAPSYFTHRRLAFKRPSLPSSVQSEVRAAVNDVFLRPSTANGYPASRSNWSIAVEVSDQASNDLLATLSPLLGDLKTSMISLLGKSDAAMSSLTGLARQLSPIGAAVTNVDNQVSHITADIEKISSTGTPAPSGGAGSPSQTYVIGGISQSQLRSPKLFDCLTYIEGNNFLSRNAKLSQES